MKKTFAFMLFMLMVSIGVQAQTLVGQWKAQLTEDNQKMDCFLTFKESTYSMKVKANMTDSEVGTVYISILMPGAYTVEDKVLNLNIDQKKSNVKIDKIDFNTSIRMVLSQMPEMEKEIMREMRRSMAESKDEIMKEMPVKGALTIVSLTDKELVLEDKSNAGESIKFTRIK